MLEFIFLYPGQTMSPLNEQFCAIDNTCGVDVEILKNMVWIFIDLHGGLIIHCIVFFVLVLRKFLPITCDEFMTDLVHLDESIANCNDIFEYQTSEMGRCFTANGLYFQLSLGSRKKKLCIQLVMTIYSL